MAKLTYLKGSTAVSTYVFIQDATVSTGAGKTGLAFNTASLTAYYVRAGSAATPIALVTQTPSGAWVSGGFAEVDSVNMPGLYRLDIPNAVLATGADSVVLMMRGAAGMAPLTLEIELWAVDPRNAANFAGVNLTQITGSAALAAAFAAGMGTVVVGTVGVGSTTTTIVTQALSPAGTVAGQFNGRALIFLNNTLTAALQSETRSVAGSTTGAAPTFTVAALGVPPQAGDSFIIV